MTRSAHRKTVLVGIDGNANCAAAVRWAAAEAARRGARLHAVHVVNLVDRYDARLGADPSLELAHARETVPGRVAGWVFAAAVDVDIVVTVLAGDVAEHLAAEAKDAVLVVVGAPDGPQHQALVSTLAARCLCPVVVVTESGDSEIVQVTDASQPEGASHVVRP